MKKGSIAFVNWRKQLFEQLLLSLAMNLNYKNASIASHRSEKKSTVGKKKKDEQLNTTIVSHTRHNQLKYRADFSRKQITPTVGPKKLKIISQIVSCFGLNAGKQVLIPDQTTKCRCTNSFFFFAPSPCKPYFSHCMVICLSNNFLFSLQGQPISSLTHATFLYLSLYQLLLFFFSSTLFPFYTCRRRIGESEKGFIVLP